MLSEREAAVAPGSGKGLQANNELYWNHLCQI